jgi:pyrroline-5-carboxylate reductase
MATIGPLLIIGGGVMGRAIVEGGLRAGAVRASDLIVAEPDGERRSAFDAMDVAAFASVGLAMDAARVQDARGAATEPAAVVLAVKPQAFAGVADELRAHLGASERLVISIMAGLRASAIRESLGGGVRVVRAMPNTPARVGQGVTGVASGPGATEGDMALAMRLFGALGPLVVRIDESLMDAFTAVAGSGPAYLFYLAEAMERGAVGVGLSRDEARAVVAQTLRGAAALLDGSDPAALRAAVTSKGGTTAAAIASMERGGVAGAIAGAIVAARDRGCELAG